MEAKKRTFGKMRDIQDVTHLQGTALSSLNKGKEVKLLKHKYSERSIKAV